LIKYVVVDFVGFFSQLKSYTQVRLEVSKFLSEVKNILLRAENEQQQSKIRALESVPEAEAVSDSSSSSSVDKDAATEITSIAGETDFLLLLAQGMHVSLCPFMFSASFFKTARSWILRPARMEHKSSTIFFDAVRHRYFEAL